MQHTRRLPVGAELVPRLPDRNAFQRFNLKRAVLDQRLESADGHLIQTAGNFAETSGEYYDKLQGVPYGLTPGGSPFLLDCLAYLDCKVIDRARAGDHTVVVGEVTASDTLDPSYPLIYDPSEYEEALR